MSLGTILMALPVVFLVASHPHVKCKPAPMGCIEPGGDWVDGVTKRGCIKALKGEWTSTYSPLDGNEFCKPAKRNHRKVS